MGLRQDKKEATRRNLADAARMLTQDRALADVTVDDIAAAAGMSRRTFFNYFDTKEAALAAGFDRADLLIEALRSRPADEPGWTAMTHAVLSMTVDHREARTTRERWSELSGDPSVIRQAEASRLRLERLMARELERRSPDVTPLAARVTAGVFLATLRLGYRSWVEDGEPGDSPRATIERALELAKPTASELTAGR